jgi:hypothetical protein
LAGVTDAEVAAELEVSPDGAPSVGAKLSKTAAFCAKGRPGSGTKMDGGAVVSAGDVN